MKFQGFLAVTLTLGLIFSPQLAHASTENDPGPIPISSYLNSDDYNDPTRYSYVINEDGILLPQPEARLEALLATLAKDYEINPIVEYVDNVPGNSGNWVETRADNLGLNKPDSNAVYIVVFRNQREVWMSLGSEINKAVTPEKFDEILNSYVIPDMKKSGFLTAIAIGVESIGRSYAGLPLLDYATTSASNGANTVNPQVNKPTQEELEAQAAQAAKDAKAAEEHSAALGNAMLWIGGIVLGLGAVALLAYLASTFVKVTRAKKAAALAAIENARLKKLVDQLVPRLRKTEEFFAAESQEERLKIADKASFAVYGLKAADKEKVLKLAEEYVTREAASGLNPVDSIDTNELMNLSIKAFADMQKQKR